MYQTKVFLFYFSYRNNDLKELKMDSNCPSKNMANIKCPYLEKYKRY